MGSGGGGGVFHCFTLIGIVLPLPRAIWQIIVGFISRSRYGKQYEMFEEKDDGQDRGRM